MKKSIDRIDLLAWLLIAGFGMLMVFSLNTTMYYSPDSANYLGWAKSLAFFHGYELRYGPEVSRYVVNAPLYPVLLAPIARFFPLDVFAAKIFTLGFGLLLLFLFYRYTSARTGSAVALLGLLFLATNPQTVLFSTQVLCDVPFGVCMILIFLVAERLLRDDSSSTWLFWSLVALLTAGVLLREIGFALLFAVVLSLALRKDYVRAGLLFLAPVLVYFIWYIRNEVVIASAEINNLHNTSLFFSHVLTGSTGSLLGEFATRVQNNAAFYAAPLGGLLFISQYVGWVFPVLNFNDPMLAAVQSLADALILPISALTLILGVYGAITLWRKEPTGRIITSFIMFYTVIILLYPINDYRFLFPLLLIVAYLATIALNGVVEWIAAKENKRVWSVTFAACTVLLLLPNIVWLRNFTTTAAGYKSKPDILYSEISKQARYPIEYTKQFPQVDEWIDQHSDSSAVIIGRYQEAAIWLHGRKLLMLDPLVSPGDFEGTIRDYQGKYIIAYMVGHQLHDFEFQMAVSGKYRFAPVFRSGDVEVLQIYAKGDSTESSLPTARIKEASGGGMRRLLLSGISGMGHGNYESAVNAFKRLRSVDGYEAAGAFYSAVVAELSGNFVEARKLFRQFSELPQAGTFLLQAQAHEEIINSLEAARQTPSRAERAAFYHSASLSYWILGFHHQAEKTMQQCIAADSSYFIGPVFAALYALERNDLQTAEDFAEKAAELRPKDPLVASLQRIIASSDSLQHATDTHMRALHLIAIGKDFISLGLNDFAIEDLVKAVELDPTNTTALGQLSDLYILKRRFAPAARTLSRLLDVDPSNIDAKNKLESILEEDNG